MLYYRNFSKTSKKEPERRAPNLYWFHPEAVGLNDLSARKAVIYKKKMKLPE